MKVPKPVRKFFKGEARIAFEDCGRPSIRKVYAAFLYSWRAEQRDKRHFDSEPEDY